MKKKVLAFLLAAIMVMTMLPTVAFATTEPWDGDGSSANPWLIGNLEDLVALDTYVESGETCEGKFFKLTADIGSENGDKFTTPIGSGARVDSAKTFNGNFDGDGHTVWLALNGEEYNDDDSVRGLGLFSSTINATVSNVTMAGTITFADSYYVGGIAGYTEGGSFTNCTNKAAISSTVDTSSSVGGLFGEFYDDEDYPSVLISNCRNEADINVADVECVGGIVGQCYFSESGSILTDCSNSGNITAKFNNPSWNKYAGGVVGSGAVILADHCWNTGDVNVTGNGSVYVGGFAGELCGYDTHIVRNCYSVGDVTSAYANTGGFCAASCEGIINCYYVGDVKVTDNVTEGEAYIGGFCGYNEGAPFINCYSFGVLTCTGETCNDLGGFCGVNDTGGTFENCYFDNVKCTVTDTNEGVTGIATSLVQNSGTDEEALVVKLNAFVAGVDTNQYGKCSSWENKDETYPVFEVILPPSANIKGEITPADFSYSMVIPADTTLDESNYKDGVLLGSGDKAGLVSIENIKHPATNIDVFYTVDLTDGDLTDGTTTITTNYGISDAADGEFAALAEETQYTVYTGGTVKNTYVNVSADEEDWNAAPVGDYNATLVFNFDDAEVATLRWIIDTVDGGFPKDMNQFVSANKPWKNGDKTISEGYTGQGLKTYDLDSYSYIPITATAKKDASGNYVYSYPGGNHTLTFNMTEGKLTSITYFNGEHTFELTPTGD